MRRTSIRQKGRFLPFALFAIMLLMIGSCALGPSFPSEMEGTWYRDWEAIGDWESFYFDGKVMQQYNTYYDDLGYEMPWCFTLLSLDEDLGTFTVKSDSSGTEHDWIYEIDASGLSLTADTGYSFHLTR